MKRFQLFLIFITIFIDLIGFGIVMPVLPEFAKKEPFSASPLTIGLIFASFSVMQLICAPIFGKLSDRYGRRPILFFSMIGTAASFLILGFATTIWMLFLGRMLDGVTGANISTAQAYIADITTPEERVKGMGLIGAAFGLGFVFGPAIGGILSTYGHSVPFFFAAGLALANGITLYFILPETVKPGTHTATTLSEGRLSRLLKYLQDGRLSMLIVIYFLVTLAFSIMTLAFIQFTDFRFSYDPKENGLILGFLGIIAAIMQGGLIGFFTRKFGETRLAVVGTILMSVSLFALPLIGPQVGGLAALLIGVAVFAIGQSFATPTVLTLASKSVSTGEQGSVMGVMQSSASMARIIGPALSGLLLTSAVTKEITDFTAQLTFWTATGIMVVAFILTCFFAARHRTTRSDENALTFTQT